MTGLELSIIPIIGVLKFFLKTPAEKLAETLGADAARAAASLFNRIAEKLDPMTVERLKENPERTQQVEDDLADAAEADPEFTKEIQQLYEQWKAAATARPGGDQVVATITASPGAQQIVGDQNVQIRG